jgi:hypothetical protein
LPQLFARRLEQRDLHATLAQQLARALRIRAIAALDDLGADREGGARRMSGALAGGLGDRGDEAHAGRLAVAAGDQRDRDVVHAFPGHVVGRGQRACRPRAHAGAESDGDALFVREERDAARAGGGRELDHRGIRFLGDDPSEASASASRSGGSSPQWTARVACHAHSAISVAA